MKFIIEKKFYNLFFWGKILFFLAALLFLNSKFYILNSEAQISLGVSQQIFDLDILPGLSHTEEIRIVNQGGGPPGVGGRASPTMVGGPVPVHLAVSPWDLKEDSDDIEFVTAEPSLNAAGWFTMFDPVTGLAFEDLILDPGEERRIRIEITPPSDAARKSYQAMLRFQAVPLEHQFDIDASKLIPEIGVLFFLRIRDLGLDAGGEDFRAEIISFEPAGASRIGFLERLLGEEAHASVWDDLVSKFLVSVRNNGRYHFKSAGYIEIKNMFGRVIEHLPLPEKYMLSGKTRSFSVPSGIPLPDVRNQGYLGALWTLARRSVSVGPHTATLILLGPASPAGGPDARSEIATMRFWVFPWKFWLIAGALIIVLIITILRGRGRVKAAMRALRGNYSH